MPFKIDTHDVSFSYQQGVPIVDGLNLSLRSDEVTAVISSVGGGKTTFLKICAGLVQPVTGDVMIDGRYFWNLSSEEQDDLRRRMAFDFQEAALISNMSVFNNLALPLRYFRPASKREGAALIRDWLERMGMLRYIDVLPAALSVGLRRRVSYIRAMIADSEYYFWDEPTAGADEEHIKRLEKTILEKREQGVGSLISTRNEAFLGRLAGRVLVLDGARIAYDGPLQGGRIPVAMGIEGMLRE